MAFIRTSAPPSVAATTSSRRTSSRRARTATSHRDDTASVARHGSQGIRPYGFGY